MLSYMFLIFSAGAEQQHRSRRVEKHDATNVFLTCFTLFITLFLVLSAEFPAASAFPQKAKKGSMGFGGMGFGGKETGAKDPVIFEKEKVKTHEMY